MEYIEAKTNKIEGSTEKSLPRNVSFMYAYKKTERIVAALFVVTDIMRDNEPLGLTLRSKGLHLLSEMYALQVSGSERSKMACDVALRELNSLLEVAGHAHQISPMNKDILQDELVALSAYVFENRETFSHLGEELQNRFFDVSKGSAKVSPAEVQKSIANEPHGIKDIIKDKTVHDAGVLRKKTRQNALTRHASKGQNSESSKEQKRSRRAKIFEILQNKEGVNIKDISAIITDCSEKTIQRELTTLVAQGVLKREGERRWSVYRLVS